MSGMEVNLLKIIKGGSGSGNFGHVGRPGHVGGSATNGGEISFSVNFKEGDSEQLIRHYDLLSKCGQEIDCHALKSYTSMAYGVVNTYLRHGTYQDTVYSEVPQSRVDEIVKGIDKSFNNAPKVPGDLKVFRGMDSSLLSSLQEGDIFKDDGFISTSIDKEKVVSGGFIEIHVPKGSKGIYLEQISEVKRERELLLDRGSRFRVLSNELKPNRFGDMIRNVVMELINDQ